MLVLLVANGNYKFRGQRYYSVERLIENGLVRNGHHVYFFSDRDTARASNLIASSRLGASACNRVFVDTCRNLAPDLIVFGHADLITRASLQQVRALLPDVRMAQFNVDPLFRSANVAAIAEKTDLMDATFVTTGGDILRQFAGRRSLVAFIPNPVDASVQTPRCHERSDQPNDVFFAARPIQAPLADDPRAAIPAFIEASGRVRIDYYGVNGRPQLYGRSHFRQIESARIGLNISSVREKPSDPRGSEAELYLYSSDRIAHYLGSGLMVCTTRDNHLEDLFAEDREMVFFSSQEELLDKLVYYKTHDNARRQIAAAGYHRAHRYFNERLVAKFIVEHTFRSPLSESYAWPTQAY
jgi:hypothetical protein